MGACGRAETAGFQPGGPAGAHPAHDAQYKVATRPRRRVSAPAHAPASRRPARCLPAACPLPAALPPNPGPGHLKRDMRISAVLPTATGYGANVSGPKWADKGT